MVLIPKRLRYLHKLPNLVSRFANSGLPYISFVRRLSCRHRHLNGLALLAHQTLRIKFSRIRHTIARSPTVKGSSHKRWTRRNIEEVRTQLRRFLYFYAGIAQDAECDLTPPPPSPIVRYKKKTSQWIMWISRLAHAPALTHAYTLTQAPRTAFYPLRLSPSRLVGRWLARSPGTTEIRKSLKISNIKYSNNGKEAKNEPKGDPGYTNFHRPCVYLNHIKRLAVHSEKIILIMPNS